MVRVTHLAMLVHEVVGRELAAADFARVVLYVGVEEPCFTLGRLRLVLVWRRVQVSPRVLLVAVVALERMLAELAGVHLGPCLALVLTTRLVVTVEHAVELDRTVTASHVHDHLAVTLGRLSGRGQSDGHLVGGVGEARGEAGGW